MKQKMVKREDPSETAMILVAALGVVGREDPLEVVMIPVAALEVEGWEAGGDFVLKREPFLLLLGSKFLKYSSIYDFPK